MSADDERRAHAQEARPSCKHERGQRTGRWTVSTVECGSRVRVLEGRNSGRLGTVRSVTTDAAGDDYLVEYANGAPAGWVRPAHVEIRDGVFDLRDGEASIRREDDDHG